MAFELLSVTCHIALLRFVNLILKKKECIVIINTMFIQHYVSCGMWHMSPVTFQMSHVTCHMSQKKGESGGAGQWRVCYQPSLPRLVLRTG